ncbi:MAG: hypothetical protein K6G07_08630 [Lachnospiraceae bacterium]|nr:hypothetical protein [Lachnospiraceae bacterium]
MSSSEDYLDRLLQQAMQTEENIEKTAAVPAPEKSSKKSAEALMDEMLAVATGQKLPDPEPEPIAEAQPIEETAEQFAEAQPIEDTAEQFAETQPIEEALEQPAEAADVVSEEKQELEDVSLGEEALPEGFENGTPISNEDIDKLFSFDEEETPEEETTEAMPEEASAEEFVEEVPEAPVEEFVEAVPEAPVEEFVEAVPEAPVEEFVEAVPEAPVEEFVEAVPETPVEEFVEDMSEAPVEEFVEAMPEAPEAEFTVATPEEVPVEEIPEEPVAEPAEEPAKEFGADDIDMDADLNDILGILEDGSMQESVPVTEDNATANEVQPVQEPSVQEPSVQEPVADPMDDDLMDEDLIDINADVDIDELLGLKPDTDIPEESHIEEELKAAASTEAPKAPNLQDKDLMDILDVLGDGDAELAEINDILTKDENNEYVAPEHMEQLAAPVTEDAENPEEEEAGKKKKKKGLFSKLFGKKKKGEDEEDEVEAPVADAESDEDMEPIGDNLANAFAEPPSEEPVVPFANLDGGELSLDDMLEASNVGVDEDGVQEIAVDPETGLPVGGDDLADIGDKKKKKKGLLARLFALLTEEVEDEDEGGVDAVLGEDGIPEKGKKGKKKKKGKGKKGKEVSNEDIAAEMDAEDAAAIPDKKEKKKKKKAKKPKKEKPVEVEEPGKKLPKKMVRRIFVLCFSVLVALLLIIFVVPGLLNTQRARNAYEDKDYQAAYEAFLGNKLNDSDKILMKKSTMMVTLENKYSLAKAFMKAERKDSALNALLEGVAYYDDNLASIEEYNIVDEANKRLTLIIDLLSSEFGVSADNARELLSLSALDYTHRVKEISSGSAPELPPADAPDVSENTLNEEPPAEQPAPELTDPLESELDN